jgi:hypothetical protein
MNDPECEFDASSAAPLWAQELLAEIIAVRHLLEEQRQNGTPSDFYDFVNAFRKAMQADTVSGNYPEVNVDGRRYGVTRAGLLYDKATSKEITRTEAFALYRRLYEQHKRRPLF